MAESITLKYYDTEWHSQAFTALSVKGLDDPDKVEICGFQFPAIDGSIMENVLGFRRVITADLGAVQTHALRVWVHNFLNSETRRAILSDDWARIVIGTPQGFESYWQHDSELGKSFVLEIVEDRIRSDWPFYPSDAMIGYSINHVKIEGTQDSPELFTTNTEKLQYRFGTTPFPDIDLDDYLVTIAFGSYSDAKFNLYGTVTQDGNNIAFYVAMNDGAMADSSDGFVYADITILLDAKT